MLSLYPGLRFLLDSLLILSYQTILEDNSFLKRTILICSLSSGQPAGQAICCVTYGGGLVIMIILMLMRGGGEEEEKGDVEERR